MAPNHPGCLRSRPGADVARPTVPQGCLLVGEAGARRKLPADPHDAPSYRIRRCPVCCAAESRRAHCPQREGRHRAGMSLLLATAAADPQSSPALLAVLLRDGDWQTHQALLSNPTLSDRDTRTLMLRPGAGITDFLNRPGSTADDALTFFRTARPSSENLVAALCSVADPDGRLARFAIQHGRTEVWRTVLQQHTAPTEVLLEAATKLAARPGPAKSDATLIWCAVRTPTDRAAVVAAASDTMLHILRSRSPVPVPDSVGWFFEQDTATTLAACAGKSARTWSHAIEGHRGRDSVTTILDAALSAAPRDAGVLRRALELGTPTQKAQALLQYGSRFDGVGVPDAARVSLAHVLATAPLPAMRAVLGVWSIGWQPSVLRPTELTYVLRRADLTADDLQALERATARTRRPYRGYERHTVHWYAHLAAHRATGPTLRARAVQQCTQGQADVSWAVIARIGATLGTHPHDDAVAGRNLLVRDLSDANSLTDAVRERLQAALRSARIDEAEQATALTQLAPTFPGTVGELLDVASTIATT